MRRFWEKQIDPSSRARPGSQGTQPGGPKERSLSESSRARPDSQGTQPGGNCSVSLCDYGLGSGPESEQLFKGLTDEQEAQIRSVIAKVPGLKKPEARRTRYSRKSKPSETSIFFEWLPATESDLTHRQHLTM